MGANDSIQIPLVNKNQPGFFPSGPLIVPKQFVDRTKVQIRLKFKGKTMQDWPISDMIFSPQQIWSDASERVRLMPGDMLITGSPTGNGAMYGDRFFQPGDIVESEITYLGRQVNKGKLESATGKPSFGPFLLES